MAPKPLALTDGQMSAVMNAAASLLPRDRDAFLRALAVVLHDAPHGLIQLVGGLPPAAVPGLGEKALHLARKFRNSILQKLAHRGSRCGRGHS